MFEFSFLINKFPNLEYTSIVRIPDRLLFDSRYSNVFFAVADTDKGKQVREVDRPGAANEQRGGRKNRIGDRMGHDVGKSACLRVFACVCVYFFSSRVTVGIVLTAVA